MIPRVYISGQITGTKDYLDRFGKAETYLIQEGYAVVNPAKVLSMLPGVTTHEEYMKMSMVMLDMCDIVYMLDGWEESCGANREYGYALAMDKEIVYERSEIMKCEGDGK